MRNAKPISGIAQNAPACGDGPVVRTSPTANKTNMAEATVTRKANQPARFLLRENRSTRTAPQRQIRIDARTDCSGVIMSAFLRRDSCCGLPAAQQFAESGERGLQRRCQ